MRYGSDNLIEPDLQKGIDEQFRRSAIPIRKSSPIELVGAAEKLIGKDVDAIFVDWLSANKRFVHIASRDPYRRRLVGALMVFQLIFGSGQVGSRIFSNLWDSRSVKTLFGKVIHDLALATYHCPVVIPTKDGFQERRQELHHRLFDDRVPIQNHVCSQPFGVSIQRESSVSKSPVALNAISRGFCSVVVSIVNRSM